jgi:hypothetical protein
MIARRVAVVALGVVLSLASAAAQESAREFPSDAVANWTAPPYWTPPVAAELEKVNDAGALDPMAVEGVPTAPLPFVGITPCRLVDTRPSQGFTGAYGPPILAANATRDFDLNSAPHCPGVAANAEAYSLNLTITDTTGPGDIRVWPTGTAPLNVSTQNWSAAGIAIANAAIVPAGTNGSITVQIAGSNTHLIIDINGYYVPQTVVNTVNGLSGAVTLAAGANVSITPSGNTLTIASSGVGSDWSLIGNSGTTPGTNFLGTTDNQALELKVNGARALRLEPTATTPNVLGGWPGNSVTTGAVGATVSGGGGVAGGLPNQVTDDHGTVSGGAGNRAGDASGTTDDKPYATVGGGFGNVASGFTSVVAGGVSNSAGNDSAVTGGFSNDAQCCRNFVGGGENNTAGPGSWLTVAGGLNNAAQGSAATVGGGSGNSAINSYATVPGGRSNYASAQYSFAAGRRAQATHQGAFVWGDSTDADVASTAVNQVIVRASGGIWLGTTSSPSFDIATDFLRTSTGAHLTIGGAWTNSSDFNRKEDFEQIDKHDVLARVATLPISRWSYKAEDCSVRHMGPTGQDFAEAFGLGTDERSIATVDADGVALVAIQALYQEVQELRKRLAALEEAKD